MSVRFKRGGDRHDRRIALERPADWWVDVWAFEARRTAGSLEAVRKAIALYQGDLAPEIHDDWILPRRVFRREAYLADLLRLGDTAARECQFERDLDLYSRYAAGDPLREDGQRGLMRALAALGRLDEAWPAAETAALARPASIWRP